MGVGPGNQKYDYRSAEKVKYLKYFIQPSYGFSDKHFEFAFSSKFSLVDFKPKTPADVGASVLYWEPGFIVKAGSEKCKVIFQCTFTAPSYADWVSSYNNYSLGVLIPFSLKPH